MKLFYDNISDIIIPCIKERRITRRLVRLLERKAYYRYFFKTIDDPLWIPILYINGLLDFRPDIDDYYWPIEYLHEAVNKTDQYDEIILKSLLGYKEASVNVEQLRFNDMKITQTCSMFQTDVACKSIPIIKWTLDHPRSSDSMVLSYLEPLFVKLYGGEYFKEGRDLFSMILKLSYDNEGDKGRIGKFEFKYDRYWVDELFKKIIPLIIEDDIIFYFKHVINEYRAVLLKSHPPQDDNLYHDYSYINRPSIEDDKHNMGLSEEDTIIRIIKDLIDQSEIVKEKTDMMEVLLHEDYPVFKRLALYAFTENFSELKSKYSSILLTRENFNNTHLTHELYRLLREKYSEFINKDEIQRIIKEDLGKYYPNFSYDRIQKIQIEDELRWLSAIQENEESNARVERIKVLHKEIGHEPEHQEYVYYSEVKFGYDSPIPYKELFSMKFTDIKAELLRFEEKEPEDHLDIDSGMEGLARYFKTTIEERMEDFIENINIFKDTKIKVRFLGSILSGLSPDDNVYNHIQFKAALDFADWIFTEAEKKNMTFTTKSDYNLSYAFKGLFYHFHKLVGNDDNNLSDDDYEDMKSVLMRYSMSYNVENIRTSDPFQNFINTTYGDFLQAWFSINLRMKKEDNSTRMLPEFKGILDSGIGTDRFVHVLLGRYLPNIRYLDQDWVDDNLKKIFPSDSNSEIWLITFKSFLWTTIISNELFLQLVPHLLKGAKLTNLESSELISLGERIGVYYLRPETHHSCYKSIIKPLSEDDDTNPGLFSNITSFIGRVYDENLYGDYTRKYVRYRYRILRSSSRESKDELHNIIALSRSFPKKMKYWDYLIFRFALYNLVKENKWPNQRDVFNLLEDFTDRKPSDYLYRLLKIDLSDPQYIRQFDERYRNIFKVLYESKNIRILKGVSVLINKLGEDGHYEFHELYKNFLKGEFE